MSTQDKPEQEGPTGAKSSRRDFLKLAGAGMATALVATSLVKLNAEVKPGRKVKKWETASGNRCRLVVTMAVYDPAVAFMAYARYKGETWIFSSPSPAAGNRLATMLKENGITDKVIATQIVPSPDSSLPVVLEARKALGANLNYESLESYIVGKLFVTIMQAIDGPLTRENFLKAARRQPYDIGGVKVDFTTDNQGSDFVQATYLRDGQFTAITTQELVGLFK
jgi:hypothetical protein